MRNVRCFQVCMGVVWGLCCCAAAHAQIGGNNTYEFLNMPASARIAALGGSLIGVSDDDLTLVAANPAAANATMHGQVSVQHSPYVADIQHGYAGYAHHSPRQSATWVAGVQYVSLGRFALTDPSGQQLGSFRAGEMAVHVGGARQLSERWRLGANAKLVWSQLAAYTSVGLAADVAAMYTDTARLIEVSLVVRNVGTQITAYSPDTGREPLPFDVQWSFSKRLEKLPLRLSVVAHHLTRWNIRYNDPNFRPLGVIFVDPTATTERSYWVDNLFRHLIFNGEFLLGRRENLRLRFGYNHLRRAELIQATLGGLSGFSAGFGVKVRNIRIDYGFASYHLAGVVHHIGLSANLNEWLK